MADSQLDHARQVQKAIAAEGRFNVCDASFIVHLLELSGRIRAEDAEGDRSSPEITEVPTEVLEVELKRRVDLVKAAAAAAKKAAIAPPKDDGKPGKKTSTKKPKVTDDKAPEAVEKPTETVDPTAPPA